MIAKETTKNRTFTIEVDEEELKILHSLVGASPCNLFTPDGGWAPEVSTRLSQMWASLSEVAGDKPAYALRITRE